MTSEPQPPTVTDPEQEPRTGGDLVQFPPIQIGLLILLVLLALLGLWVLWSLLSAA